MGESCEVNSAPSSAQKNCPVSTEPCRGESANRENRASGLPCGAFFLTPWQRSDEMRRDDGDKDGSNEANEEAINLYTSRGSKQGREKGIGRECAGEHRLRAGQAWCMQSENEDP